MQSTESRIQLDSNHIVTSKTLINSIRYYYDSEDKLTKKYIKFADNSEQVITYEQAENDSQIVKFSVGEKTVTSHSKNDSFGRKIFDELQLSTGFVSRQFSYVAGLVTDEHKENNMLKSSPTTQLISRIVLSDGRTLDYEYDGEERITKVIDSVDGTTEYTYDALGQLLTETKNGAAVNTMTYDNYGNILTKNGITYSYDSVWKDKLISVGDKTITYDAQGNPTNYLGNTLNWQKGRQLEYIMTPGVLNIYAFTYNANGIRTSKSVNGVFHTYTLDGTKILRETWANNILETLYDNEDNVCGIIYNSIPYYFFKNQQGDIIGITDKTGKEIAKYSYDAWGVPTVEQDNSGCDIANINPYRYRGYYYDQESGLYYLQSRYYDPVVGRFINGDEAEYIVIGRNANEYNLFAYCMNDCVNTDDGNGKIAARIVSAIIGGILSLFIEFIVTAGMYYYKRRTFSGYKVNTWGMIIAFVTGSVSGALMVSSLKRGAQAAIGAITGFVTAYIDEVKKAKKKTTQGTVLCVLCPNS